MYEWVWVIVVVVLGFDVNVGLFGIEMGSWEVGCLVYEIKLGIFLGKIISIDFLMYESLYMVRVWI